ncbi:MAG: DUF5719 family protein [Streptosporangiaceae bacterium]
MRPARFVPAGVVLLALCVIAGVAQLVRPAPATTTQVSAASRQVAVSSAVRACPPAQGGGSGKVALIAGSPGSLGPASPATAAGLGQVELTPLPLAGVQLHAVSPISQTDPGALSLLTVPAASSVSQKGTTVAEGWSVTGTGLMAPAMEAEETESSGLSSVRCGEPGSDIWFVGPGQGSGAKQIQLDLMNIDALAASVDVSVITQAGPVQADGDTGITVPPYETVTESLSALGASSPVVAIEVRTSIGRVAADVWESSAAGSSWLPSTTAPSTSMVIPGVPPSGSEARLFIAVPGSLSARVSVLAITSQGLYHPFGAQTVDVPPNSAFYAQLAPAGGTAAALVLTSNVPVSAAVLVPGSGLGAFTAATAPISEQAVVAGNTTGSGLSASIALSAPAGAARVRLTEIALATSGHAAGPSVSQVVSVQARHTLVVSAAPPKGNQSGSTFTVVITPLPGSGPLYAARVETQGQSTVVSIMPAISALTTINLPPVRNSYSAISP